MSLLENIIIALKQDRKIPTLITSESDAIEIINSFSGINITKLDAIKEDAHTGIYLYEKLEGKKEMSIDIIRKFLTDIVLRDYGGRSIYIIRDIDHASLAAMNSLLKVFEDTPDYAIIICTATTSESLLETIRSRSIIISVNKENTPLLSDDLLGGLMSYADGNIMPLLTLLYGVKLERSEAIALILKYFELCKSNLDSYSLEQMETAIERLILSNESTRNILDTIFLPRTLK
jgi:DNA polymerase III delta prime subunit